MFPLFKKRWIILCKGRQFQQKNERDVPLNWNRVWELKIFLEKMDNICNMGISLRQRRGIEPTSLQLLYKGVGEQEETVTCFKRKEVSATYLLIF